MTCFRESMAGGVGCGRHHAGTYTPDDEVIYPNLPKYFNNLGPYEDMKPLIFEDIRDWHKVNGGYGTHTEHVSIWKTLTKDNHTIIRGMIPSRNEPFLHIFLQNCIECIHCREIKQCDMDKMDQ
ncbi:MAG: hypothetical protein PHT07_23955 [Paludibacter sp.]|nr:hypothetical protein [Paludibacter sp.]